MEPLFIAEKLKNLNALQVYFSFSVSVGEASFGLFNNHLVLNYHKDGEAKESSVLIVPIEDKVEVIHIHSLEHSSKPRKQQTLKNIQVNVLNSHKSIEAKILLCNLPSIQVQSIHHKVRGSVYYYVF
jgi:hypothetical protein